MCNYFEELKIKCKGKMIKPKHRAPNRTNFLFIVIVWLIVLLYLSILRRLKSFFTFFISLPERI